MAEKINNVIVTVSTGSDDKEDSQFEVVVKQGVTTILHAKEGAGEDWNEGDHREFAYNLDVDVVAPEKNITVVGALQDGDWGRSNHWNADVSVLVQTDSGRQIEFRRFCAFRTRASRRRHEMSFGTKRFGTHSVRRG